MTTTAAAATTPDLDEVTDEMIGLTKTALGMKKQLGLDWIKPLQAWTSEVQENLENLLQPEDGAGEAADGAAAKGDEPMLSKATFLLFLNLVAKKCSKKRPADGGPTEADRAEELKKDPATYYVCLALATTIGREAGLAHIDAMYLEDKIAEADERGTEKGDERSEELHELLEEATAIQSELEGLFGEACGTMKESILAGGREEVCAVLASGEFVLDI